MKTTQKNYSNTHRIGVVMLERQSAINNIFNLSSIFQLCALVVEDRAKP